MRQENELQCFPKVEACYSWTWTDYHMTQHSHDRAEIMYLLRGKCCIQIGQDEVRLHVGEFIYIAAGVSHALQVDGSCYMVNVEFAYSEQHTWLSMKSLAEHSVPLHAWLRKKTAYQVGRDADGSFFGVLSAVVDNFVHCDTADVALSTIRLAEMMVLMAGLLEEESQQTRCLLHVRRCVNILSERMDGEVRIDDIAEEVGVSTSYLQRIFRQIQGMTIVEYLNKLRIERAKLLLSNTEDSVIDIAIASGFNSRQHFTRVFSAIEGCSPLSYRRKAADGMQKEIFLT